MVSREQAIEVVEQYLAADAALPRPTDFNGQDRLVVTGSGRHRFGWLVYCQGERWAQTRDFRDMLIGHGYFLVDEQDGSLHTLHATTDLDAGEWIEDYLEQVRGIKRPDPLRNRVSDLLHSGSRLEAIKTVRSAAPDLDPVGAKRYVGAVAAATSIPDDIVARLPARPWRFPVWRALTGPAADAP